MARIQNLDDLGQRFISLTRGDIPEGLRWKALTGVCLCARGSRRWRADGSRESHWVRRDAVVDHDAVALDLSGLPDEVRALIAMQAATIARLQAQLAKLRRMHFGRSSERLASSIAQLELALEDLEEQQALTQPDDAAPDGTSG
jgi:hypothetical protein